MRSDEEERLARTVVVRNVYSSILQSKVMAGLLLSLLFEWSTTTTNAHSVLLVDLYGAWTQRSPPYCKKAMPPLVPLQLLLRQS